jgi:hypothetical protein
LSQADGHNTKSLLETAQRITAPGAIQLKKRAATRLPHPAEAMALLIGALGAVDRWSGVRIMNIEHDGKPLAIALIEHARFGQDPQGNTSLSAIVDAKKVE